MTETDLTPREALAKEFDAIHNRLFVMQILLVAVLLLAYQLSGASALLANGLTARFGESHWYMVNAVYTLVTMFGFVACMFPLAYYSEHVMELHYELSDETFEEWFSDFFRSLLVDLLLAVLLFSGIYALLRWMPNEWWILAAILYILFTVTLSTLVPLAIVSSSRRFEPLEEGELVDAVRSMAKETGIPLAEVCKWKLDERSDAPLLLFIGLGQHRRVIFGDTLLSSYSQEEILAIFAHELGHLKNRDTLRRMAVSSILALVGFYVAHRCLSGFSGLLGFAHIYDIGAAPLFIFSLFIFSLVSMPFANLHSRRREFAADAYAIERMGSATALISAFEKQADQNLSNRAPAAWIEFLLHSQPSIAHRIERVNSQ